MTLLKDLIVERVKGDDSYTWYTYDSPKGTKLTTKAGRAHTLKKGDKFGVRSSSKKGISRLVADSLGNSIIFSMEDKAASRIAAKGKVTQQYTEAVISKSTADELYRKLSALEQQQKKLDKNSEQYKNIDSVFKRIKNNLNSNVVHEQYLLESHVGSLDFGKLTQDDISNILVASGYEPLADQPDGPTETPSNPVFAGKLENGCLKYVFDYTNSESGKREKGKVFIGFDKNGKIRADY